MSLWSMVSASPWVFTSALAQTKMFSLLSERLTTLEALEEAACAMVMALLMDVVGVLN